MIIPRRLPIPGHREGSPPREDPWGWERGDAAGLTSGAEALFEFLDGALRK